MGSPATPKEYTDPAVTLWEDVADSHAPSVVELASIETLEARPVVACVTVSGLVTVEIDKLR